MNVNLTNILLIHHQPEEKLKQDLHKPGYHVVTVSCPAEGFRQLLQQNFSLILLAILPKTEKIITLIQRLAEIYDIPIVYL